MDSALIAPAIAALVGLACIPVAAIGRYVELHPKPKPTRTIDWIREYEARHENR